MTDDDYKLADEWRVRRDIIKDEINICEDDKVVKYLCGRRNYCHSQVRYYSEIKSNCDIMKIKEGARIEYINLGGLEVEGLDNHCNFYTGIFKGCANNLVRIKFDKGRSIDLALHTPKITIIFAKDKNGDVIMAKDKK